MARNEILWSLYENKAYDEEYRRSKSNLPANIRQIFNCVPLIISTDTSMALKGLSLVGSKIKEFEENNDMQYLYETSMLYMLMDGICYVDITKIEDTVYFDVYSEDEVSEVKYDAGGKIIAAKISRTTGETTVSKTYEEDKIIIQEGDEEQTFGNAYGFVPLVDLNGMKASKEPVSRINGIDYAIDLINEYYADIKSISKLHADPLIYGNVSLDVEERSEIDAERSAEEDRTMRFANVPEGGKLAILEMQGTVLKEMRAERDGLKDEMRKTYPELLIEEMASGSGLTGQSMKVKLTSLISTVTKFRTAFKAAWRTVMKYAYAMTGAVSDVKISYEEMLPANEVEMIAMTIQARSVGLLDKETAVKLCSKYLGVDPDDVFDKVLQEDEVSEVSNETSEAEYGTLNQTPADEVKENDRKLQAEIGIPTSQR
jgi:hypothetical protein